MILKGESMCENCRFDVGSYHCIDCEKNVVEFNDLKSFCPYCNYQKGSEECGNCVWLHHRTGVTIRID